MCSGDIGRLELQLPEADPKPALIQNHFKNNLKQNITSSFFRSNIFLTLQKRMLLTGAPWGTGSPAGVPWVVCTALVGLDVSTGIA